MLTKEFVVSWRDYVLKGDRMDLIPFFVVDRPISLEILRDVMLKYPSIKIGLMTHALTSTNFMRKFNKFPKDRFYSEREKELSKNLIKMSDSGIFNKNGCNLTYEELFKRYETLGVEYGIIIDFLKDSEKTIKSALKGLKIYKQSKYNFKLVAVAQGGDLDEYLKCYNKLQEYFEYIAIGGLLKKISNSARYVRVRDENFMYNILTIIRKDYSPDWLFALGCYHPSRHERFNEIGIWGSDYKGWIFNYTPRLEVLLELNKELKNYELNNGIDKSFKKALDDLEKKYLEINRLRNKWKNERDPKKKKVYYNIIKKEVQKLSDLMVKLGSWRLTNIYNNEIQGEYKELMRKYNIVLNYSDQGWRFKEVQHYIEREVYGKIKQNSGYSSM